MAFGIMRVEKRGRAAVMGLQLENNRTPEDGRHFAASDIDREQTGNNCYFQFCSDWQQEISRQIKAAGCRERKDSVVALDALYTASPEWFANHSQEDALRFFSDCYEFHSRTYGVPLNAVVHMDEKTPHLHIISVPIVRDEKGSHLSAKRLMGGRDDYRKRQDAFFEQVSHKWDLERGEPNPERKREHLSVQDYKIQQNSTQINMETAEIDTKRQEQAALTARIDTQKAELRVLAAKTDKSRQESTEAARKAQNARQEHQYAIEQTRETLERAAAAETELRQAQRQADALRGEIAKLDLIRELSAVEENSVLRDAKATARKSLVGDKITIPRRKFEEICNLAETCWVNHQAVEHMEREKWESARDAAAAQDIVKRLEQQLERYETLERQFPDVFDRMDEILRERQPKRQRQQEIEARDVGFER